jgi:ABC-type branched-subunit amino acid transport system permease subunit
MHPYRLVLVTSLVIAASFFGLDDYRASNIATGLCMGLLAVSADLSWGYCGVLNLGPVLGFGLGAYATAIAMRSSLPFPLAAVAGVVVAVLSVGILAVGTIRSGKADPIFALICLAASLCCEQLVNYFYYFTGGSNGIMGIKYRSLFLTSGIDGSNTSLEYPLLVLFVVSVSLAGVVWLVRSHLGLVMICVRDYPDRASSYGYDVRRVRLQAIAISTALAGLAGALFVPIQGIAHPSVFNSSINVAVLTWVALGGGASVMGPFFAAFLLKMIQSELGSHYEHAYLLALAVLLCVSIVRYPGGLAGSVRLLNARRLAP